MFKKRATSINPQKNIKLLNQIQDIHNEVSPSIQQNNNGINMNIDKKDQIKNEMVYKNRMKEQEQNMEQAQFLMKLKGDKKLQQLFQNISTKEEQNQQKQKEHQTLNFSQKLESNNHKNYISKYKPKPKVQLGLDRTALNPSINKPSKNIDHKVYQQNMTKISYINDLTQQRISNDIQMENIFKGILQQNQKKKQLKQNIQFKQPIPSSNHHKKVNQLIIQDQDQYVEQLPKQQFYSSLQNKNTQESMLKVTVDYEGNMSPQRQQNSNQEEDYHKNIHQQDFEDQLIRKTLTRTNYNKLLQNSNLKHTKKTQQKQKLFNKILKTSWQDIQSKLNTDINHKTNKRNQLHKEMNYLDQRLKQRQRQVDKKKSTLKQLQNQQSTLKKVIYFFCYFGDQILGSDENISDFFDDLSMNIIQKIQKLSTKVRIEQFMQKKQDRQKMKQKYLKGRKRMKLNQEEQPDQQQNNEGLQRIQEENINQEEDQDQDDGQCYMDEDDI